MSFQVIIDRLNEEEKARARDIYERYAVGDKVNGIEDKFKDK